MPLQEEQLNLPPENLAAAAAFVQATLGTAKFELKPFVSAGRESRVYACEASTGSYIVRHSNRRSGFFRDRYAREHFGDTLPIPIILDIKHLQDGSGLCLSVRMSGDIADATLLERRGTPLNTQFAHMLKTLHTTVVTGSHGHGPAKINGHGALPKWLTNTGIQHKAVSFYWGRLAKRHTTIDANTFNHVISVLRSLEGYAIGVNERRLCHGDLKNDNLLSDGQHITGVIDWDRFGYGDPAYDLGILHVRHPQAIDNYAHAEAIGITLKHLRERVLYYAILECIVAMGFSGRHGNKQTMTKSERRLLQIIDGFESQTAI